MALALQNRGTSRQGCQHAIEQALALGADITAHLINHMLVSGVLFEDSGILGLGPKGERLYGG